MTTIPVVPVIARKCPVCGYMMAYMETTGCWTCLRHECRTFVDAAGKATVHASNVVGRLTQALRESNEVLWRVPLDSPLAGDARRQIAENTAQIDAVLAPKGGTHDA